MCEQGDRTVFCREDGKWVNQRNDSSEPSSIHILKRDAVDAA